MKSILKSMLGLQMTALFLTAAPGGPATAFAVADQPVPFKGSVQAIEAYDLQFPTWLVDSSGFGTATHLVQTDEVLVIASTRPDQIERQRPIPRNSQQSIGGLV